VTKSPPLRTGEVRPDPDGYASPAEQFYACAAPRPPRRRQRHPILRLRDRKSSDAVVVPWNELPDGLVGTPQLWQEAVRRGIEISRSKLARLKRSGTIIPHPTYRVSTSGRPADAWDLEVTIGAIRSDKEAA
jgi:hypothetical protein